MSWEKCGGRPYYTRTTWVRGRAIREYIGRGSLAIMADEADALDRTLCEELRTNSQLDLTAARSALVLSHGYDKDVRAWLDQVMAQAGFYRHNRSAWRRRARKKARSASRNKTKPDPDQDDPFLFRFGEESPTVVEPVVVATLPIEARDVFPDVVEDGLTTATRFALPRARITRQLRSGHKKLTAKGATVIDVWVKLLAGPDGARADDVRDLVERLHHEVLDLGNIWELRPLVDRIIAARLESLYFAERFAWAVHWPLAKVAVDYVTTRSISADRAVASQITKYKTVGGLLLKGRG